MSRYLFIIRNVCLIEINQIKYVDAVLQVCRLHQPNKHQASVDNQLIVYWFRVLNKDVQPFVFILYIIDKILTKQCKASTNRRHNIHHTHYTNIQHTLTLHSFKKTLSLTTAATQQTFPQTPTQSLQQT